METARPTVRGLFAAPVVYVIPNYQRTYVWDESDQWEPLWQDLESIAELPEGAGESGTFEARKPHFLGAAVLRALRPVASKPTQFRVVDGQQRITTIQLLLIAVADEFREQQGLDDIERAARDLTINWEGGKPSTSDPYKVKALEGDFRHFREAMQCSQEGKAVPDIPNPIYKCYHYFRGQVGAWLAGARTDEQKRQQRAWALLTSLSDKMQVVAIHLEEGENESAIFEALNARGEPLSEWEKAKNHILFKAEEQRTLDPDQLYEDYLKDFDDRKWLEETGSGAARRRHSDWFLDYWLESKLQRAVNTRRVFREFRRRIDDENGDVDLREWCKELTDDGNRYLFWETTNNWQGDVETVFHGRRRALNIGAIWPVLMALYRSRSITNAADIDRSLRVLDSFLWRRAIAGHIAKGYDALVIDLLRALPTKPNGDFVLSNALITELSREENQSNARYTWPSDEAVREAVQERKLPNPVIRRVLEAVERGMMNGKRPGNSIMSGNLPIEHILPQRWNTQDWPLPETGENLEENRNYILHRLGNLTLVDHGLNSKLGNKSWGEKRKVLEADDNLYINKDLLNNAPDDYWDEEQILLRGERLGDYIVRIWPRGEDVTGEIERLK